MLAAHEVATVSWETCTSEGLFHNSENKHAVVSNPITKMEDA